MFKLRTKHPQKILILFGLGLGLSNTLVLTITFFHAYFNDYTTTVHINKFGEAPIEALVTPITLLVIITSFIYHIKDLRRQPC